MELDSVLEDALPRKSLFKSKGSANATVIKKEQIKYLANNTTTVVRSNQQQKVSLLISGDILLDGREKVSSV